MTRCWLLLLFSAFSTASRAGKSKVSCDTAAVGLSRERKGLSSSEALTQCGITVVRGAIPVKLADQILNSVFELGVERLDELQHGSFLGKRMQVHLPFEPPFDSLPVLGNKNKLLKPLAAHLGDDFLLDLVSTKLIPPGAPMQDPHQDTPRSGVIKVMIPLRNIVGENANARLGFCTGTHLKPRSYSEAAQRELAEWKQRNPTASVEGRAAFFREMCSKSRKLVIGAVSLPAQVAPMLKVVASKSGGAVEFLAFEGAGALDLRLGDEIREVDGWPIKDLKDWQEAVDKGEKKQTLKLRVVRVVDGVDEDDQRTSEHVITLPLKAGDAVVYDARSWHWGMENVDPSWRTTLYLAFKSASVRNGSFFEPIATASVYQARDKFLNKFAKVRTTSVLDV